MLKYQLQFSILILIVIFLNSCKSKVTPILISDPVVLKAKEVSLYSNKVNWNQVNLEYLRLTKDANDLAELQPGLEFLINSLGDKHATFRSNKDHSVVAYYTGKNDSEDNRDPEFVNEIINDIEGKFSFDLIKSDIGYLKVLGISPMASVKEQADLIRNGIVELKKEGVKKWILDLRFNGGGNMNPMMAGLAPLIGNGFVGGAVNAAEDLVQNYKIENGQFYETGRLACDMENNPAIDSTEKVAILLSRYTISSGELVAVAFKGRSNTIFIGENSAGYTTGNGYYKITDDLILNISETVYADRNLNIYYNHVPVDVSIEFNHLANNSTDEQIQYAIKWLNK